MANKRRNLRVAGVFAGIGGIELGLERAGHQTVWLCESDPAARAVLEARFDAELVGDVRKVRALPRRIDVLTAGFPCQDLSAVGRTSGIRGESSGLINEVFRLLGAKPRIPWVVLENVPFMLRLQRGRAMRLIATELETRGYRWAYRTVDARAFGLPQRRERVFIVASLHEDPRQVLLMDDQKPIVARERLEPNWSFAHGFYWTEGNRGIGWAVDAIPTLKGGSSVGIPSAPAIVLPRSRAQNGIRIVVPAIQDAERLQGFASGWTAPAAKRFKKARLRWKLVGNAVPVPAAQWLGTCLACPSTEPPPDGVLLRAGDPWPAAAWGEDGKRYEVDVSTRPVARPRQRLSSFLTRPGTPLSLRATVGFRSRLEASTLRQPSGFVRLLRQHEAALKKLDRLHRA